MKVFESLVEAQVAVASLMLTTLASTPVFSPVKVFVHCMESPLAYAVEGDSEDFRIFRATTSSWLLHNPDKLDSSIDFILK